MHKTIFLLRNGKQTTPYSSYVIVSSPYPKCLIMGLPGDKIDPKQPSWKLIDNKGEEPYYIESFEHLD